MFRCNPLFVSALMAITVSAHADGDIRAGESKAEPCRACHGARGVSVANQWPNLAGQKQTYLRQQLTAFRDGGRKDPIMSNFAQGLSDQDIADLAAYYASLSASGHNEDWYNRRREQKTY